MTNHRVATDTVYDLATAGRARWKFENENNNVLKNRGYHLEHNFSHGKEYLSNVFFTLNLLAFLTRTIQDLIAKPYQHARKNHSNASRLLQRSARIVTLSVV